MPGPGATTLVADDPRQEELVLSKAVVRAADHLGISSAVLGNVLGISGASVSRLKNGQYLISRGSKHFELAQLFVRLFRGLDAIMGGDDKASQSWLASENLALRGRPIDLVQTVTGLANVVAYVDARRARL